MNIHYALRRLREARANLADTNAILAGAVTRDEAKRLAAESAIAAETEADESTVLARAAQRRDAEVISGAATRAVAAARRLQGAAAVELKVAESDARQAAYHILSIEGTNLAAEIARDAATLAAKKAKLATLRELPGFEPTAEIAGAIGDGIHMRLCDIGPGENLDVPLNQLGRVQNSAEARDYWTARVADLLRDEPASASAVAA